MVPGQRRSEIMEQWMIKSNVEAFGHYEAAKILKKKKIPFALAYALIFNRPPKVL
jgi:hypothetical protein